MLIEARGARLPRLAALKAFDAPGALCPSLGDLAHLDAADGRRDREAGRHDGGGPSSPDRAPVGGRAGKNRRMITEFSRPRSDTPLIYISYGMMKCGSTLAFELTKGILEQNGFPQARLPKSTIPGDATENFVTSLGLDQLEAIEREAEKRGYPIVLKTHHAPTPVVKAWVEEGRILGHCAYRDLREMALSLIDNGARSRARGGKGFSNIEDLEDALDSIRKQVPRFLAWARLPGFMPLYYNDVAFDTQNTVRRLCGQLGLDADPAKVEKIVKGERPTRYNKGVPGRFREMAAEDSELILQEFRSFYEEFIEPHGEPPQLPGATAADQTEYSAGGKPHRSWRLLRKFLGMIRRA